MRKIALNSIFLALLVLLTLPSFAAEVPENPLTLGKYYLTPGVSLFKPGDNLTKDIFGEILIYGIEYNIPINPNFDLTLGGSYAKASGDYNGIDVEQGQRIFGLSGTYIFNPGRDTPFLSFSAGIVSMELEATSEWGYEHSAGGYDYFARDVYDQSDDATAFAITFGHQSILSDTVSLTLAVTYDYVDSDFLDEKDDFCIFSTFYFWSEEKTIAFSLGGGHYFEDGDSALSAGLLIPF